MRLALTKRPGPGAADGTLLTTAVVLLGVVALASRAPLGGAATVAIGAAGNAPRITRAPLGVMLVCGGAVLGLFGLFVYQRLQIALQRKRDPLDNVRIRSRRNAQIVLILLPIAAGLLIIAAGVFGSHPKPMLILHHVGFGKVNETPGQARHAGSSSSFVLPAWAPFALIGLLLTAVALILVRPFERWTPAYTGRRSATPAMKAAVKASLADLRADPDPRRAVIAAYHRMEQTLGAVGLPRARAEAPREYLTRALGSLELSAGPPRTLTNLFERAKFSLLAVDLPLRDEAISALLAMHDELEDLT